MRNEESLHQQALIRWADNHPEISGRLVASANGGLRSKATAVRLKAEGVRAGFPDLLLPMPRGEYHGLFIELKRPKPGASRVSEEQKDWISFLSRNGYACHVCYGWTDAREVIERYLANGVHDVNIKCELLGARLQRY